MAFGHVDNRGYQPPPPSTEAISSPEDLYSVREQGKFVGGQEMIKIVQPGGEFLGIPGVPEDSEQKRAYLGGFWNGMQKKIREFAADGEEGVFKGNQTEWNVIDASIGQKLTQAEINRAQGNSSERIDMSDIQDLINDAAKKIPPDVMRPMD